MLCCTAAFHPRGGCRAGLRFSSTAGGAAADLEFRPFVDGLEHHAIALGELHQRVDLLRARVAVDVKIEANRAETHGGVLGHAQRAAEIEVALGADRAALERQLERGRHRPHGDAGAGDERFQEHVAGAQAAPVAGCSPASISARPVSTLQVTPSLPSWPLALRAMTAFSGTSR